MAAKGDATTARVPIVDPTAIGMTVPGVTQLCDEHLERAAALLAQIVSGKKGGTTSKFDDTFGLLDDALLTVQNGSDFPYLMGVAHPDEMVRKAAQLCETKTDRLVTSLWLDTKLYGTLKAFAETKPKVSAEKQRFINHALRDFRRGGIELGAEQQTRLRALNAELTQLGQRFIAAISSSRGSIRVRAGSLAGLDDVYRNSHVPDSKGWVTITTDYPDYFPFVRYSRDRAAARRLYVEFTNRGGDDNVARLDRILALRHEKAKLLGYSNWADFAIEIRMAKNAATAQAFLQRVSAAIKTAAKTEYAEFLAEASRSKIKTHKGLIPPDRYFLTDRLRKRKYKLDTQLLAEYFEIGKVTKGLLAITSKMYGVEYKSVPAAAWHESVQAFEVHADGKRIGKFYLDLFPRKAKYKHAAMFTLRGAKGSSEGHTPIAALICNFPSPGKPMPHAQVVTYFHEFGHVLHQLLSRTETSRFAGTNTARDFVEAPSQMFEEWAWSRDTLDVFAIHRKTSSKIPADLLAALRRSRRAGLALSTQRQLFLAQLDLAYHTSPPGSDSTTILQAVHKDNFLFRYVEGTHFQSSFGHLISYDAGYYGYQWALSLSHDVLSRFKSEGLMNRATAADWRRHILSKGGSRDEASLVEAFLGRPATEQAYTDYLRGVQH